MILTVAAATLRHTSVIFDGPSIMGRTMSVNDEVTKLSCCQIMHGENLASLFNCEFPTIGMLAGKLQSHNNENRWSVLFGCFVAIFFSRAFPATRVHPRRMGGKKVNILRECNLFTR